MTTESNALEGSGRTEVLVVGAGPVGLLLACELARHDVPIRVIDRLPEPTTESRAIVVHARSLEMLERVGVVDALIETGVRITGFTMVKDGRQLVRASFDEVDSPFPFTVSLPQTETERILRERLAELGAVVDRGVELVSLEQDDDAVRSRLRHPDGRQQIIGPHSSSAPTAATASFAARSAPACTARLQANGSCWPTSTPTTTSSATCCTRSCHPGRCR
jgi:flavin-dependent dehydrogenase